MPEGPNQKPWRVWYSSNDCMSWRPSRRSFGSAQRAHSAMPSIATQMLRKLRAPRLALRAAHAGTGATSPVHYYADRLQPAADECAVVVKLYHGRRCPHTMVFGWASRADAERQRTTGTGSLTVRHSVPIRTSADIAGAGDGGPGRVLGPERPVAVLREAAICKLAICSDEGRRIWMDRQQKLQAVREALDRLDCTDEERAALVEALYQEDLGTRLDTESPEQIALERLVWLRRESDG